MPIEFDRLKTHFLKKGHDETKATALAAQTFESMFDVNIAYAKNITNWEDWKGEHGHATAKMASDVSFFKSDLGENDFTWYAGLAKVDKKERMVYGYATNDALDSQGERVVLKATEEALKEYSKWRNIREMHQNSAVGTAPILEMRKQGLWIGAKIVDDNAWKKVEAGVYKGFSIGGKTVSAEQEFDEVNKMFVRNITKYKLKEISLVDVPCNPTATFEMAKVDFTSDSVESKKGADKMEKEIEKSLKDSHQSTDKLPGVNDVGTEEVAASAEAKLAAPKGPSEVSDDGHGFEGSCPKCGGSIRFKASSKKPEGAVGTADNMGGAKASSGESSINPQFKGEDGKANVMVDSDHLANPVDYEHANKAETVTMTKADFEKMKEKAELLEKSLKNDKEDVFAEKVLEKVLSKMQYKSKNLLDLEKGNSEKDRVEKMDLGELAVESGFFSTKV